MASRWSSERAYLLIMIAGAFWPPPTHVHADTLSNIDVAYVSCLRVCVHVTLDIADGRQE